MELVRYEAAKRALAEYTKVDDVKSFRDKAVAVKAYAKQAGDKRLELDAAEARLRSERRLGQLMREMPKAKGSAEPGVGRRGKQCGVKDTPHSTLDDLGIDKNLAKAARVASAVPEKEFEEILEQHRDEQNAVTISTLKKVANAGKPHVSHNSGENEWYTPPIYIDAAREVMGGIDLDPASSNLAQKTVKATEYLTAEDDGLSYEWHGRVWLNPPYESGLIDKFADHVCAKEFKQAIVLVNNASETRWFQSMLAECDAVCFPAGRIRFLGVDGERGAPLQGQAILYFGHRADKFNKSFSEFGPCLEHF